MQVPGGLPTRSLGAPGKSLATCPPPQRAQCSRLLHKRYYRWACPAHCPAVPARPPSAPELRPARSGALRRHSPGAEAREGRDRCRVDLETLPEFHSQAARPRRCKPAPSWGGCRAGGGRGGQKGTDIDRPERVERASPYSTPDGRGTGGARRPS